MFSLTRWGLHGQLGHGSVEDIYRPKIVAFFRDKVFYRTAHYTFLP